MASEASDKGAEEQESSGGGVPLLVVIAAAVVVATLIVPARSAPVGAVVLDVGQGDAVLLHGARVRMRASPPLPSKRTDAPIAVTIRCRNRIVCTLVENVQMPIDPFQYVSSRSPTHRSIGAVKSPRRVLRWRRRIFFDSFCVTAVQRLVVTMKVLVRISRSSPSKPRRRNRPDMASNKNPYKE